jgi:DHA1 family tetracycline resistance protein-like MFS transporter
VSLAGIVGPLLYTSVFALFISNRAPVHLPGAPFLLACAMLVGAGVVAWRVARPPQPATTAAAVTE